MGHVDGVHVDDGEHAPAEHPLPFPLLDVLAVVGAGEGLCGPFLLEEGAPDEVRDGLVDFRQIEEIVFVPCLADPLSGERSTGQHSFKHGERRQKQGRGRMEQRDIGSRTPRFKLWNFKVLLNFILVWRGGLGGHNLEVDGEQSSSWPDSLLMPVDADVNGPHLRLSKILGMALFRRDKCTGHPF